MLGASTSVHRHAVGYGEPALAHCRWVYGHDGCRLTGKAGGVSLVKVLQLVAPGHHFEKIAAMFAASCTLTGS